MANGTTQKSVPMDDDDVKHIQAQADANHRTFAQEARHRLHLSVLNDKAEALAPPEGT